jgi:hypothetical protein
MLVSRFRKILTGVLSPLGEQHTAKSAHDTPP